MKKKITRALARKVLATVDAGLTRGLGRARPGAMCVEAAVCYALGEDHGDWPSCVSYQVRMMKIALNDQLHWRSRAERAAGLRRLAIAQLGSFGMIEREEFRVAAGDVLRLYEWTPYDGFMGLSADRFAIAEELVQVLVRLKSPGAAFLGLAKVPDKAKKLRSTHPATKP